MINNEFVSSIEKTYRDGVDIIRSKNADYATQENPWRNFNFAQLVGVSTQKAILVRVSDKLARISNLLDKAERGEVAQVDEKIEDTILDAINYLAILKAYIEQHGDEH